MEAEQERERERKMALRGEEERREERRDAAGLASLTRTRYAIILQSVFFLLSCFVSLSFILFLHIALSECKMENVLLPFQEIYIYILGKIIFLVSECSSVCVSSKGLVPTSQSQELCIPFSRVSHLAHSTKFVNLFKSIWHNSDGKVHYILHIYVVDVEMNFF